MQSAEVAEIQRSAEPQRNPQIEDIEAGQPTRTQSEGSVIEESGGRAGEA